MRRNSIVTLLVVAAVVYVFVMIPRLTTEQVKVKEYEYYTDFHDAFTS